jgi:predicted transcriptional regulator
MKKSRQNFYTPGRKTMSIDQLNDENAIQRMINRPYRAARLLPVDDTRFVNERILEELERNPLSEEELYQRFSNISYALKEILEMEVTTGNIEKYTENNKEHYRITAKGRELLQFRIGRKFLRLKSI